MRSTPLLACLVLAACSNNADPRLIAGGGIGDGEIDGVLHVHVIGDDDAPIANATVRVGDDDKTTDERGLVTFEDVEGPQTISVKAESFRSTVWVGANGANVTIPIEPLTPPTPDQATLTGTIPGWDTITVGQNHFKAGIVFYSQTDDLGDDANSIPTPAGGNICGVVGAACNWTLAARTGAITIVAMIVDRDTKGTPAEADDTMTVIGWASRAATVEKNVNQSGLQLTMVEAGNLQNVAIDLGTPPAALTETNAIVGIELSDEEVIQLPTFLTTDQASVLAPKPSVFAPDATYRLTAIAQTTSGEDGAQSIVLRRGLRDAQLAADTWLSPPTGLEVTRTRASFSPVEGAKIHTVEFDDAAGRTLLNISIFDRSTSVDVPALVSLPVSGALTARVAGIAADIDLGDFSLDEDFDLIRALATEPFSIP